MNYKPGFFEKILLKILPRFDIVKMVDGEESLYLRRFHLLKRSKFLKFLTKGRLEGIYLHHILRYDEDRHLHDHPWDFNVLILSGGYTEEIPKILKTVKGCDCWLCTDQYVVSDIKNWRAGNSTVFRNWGPFSFRSSQAEQLHRICKNGFKPSWTLFFVGPKRRKWGFMEETQWTPFDEYLAKYCPEQMKPTDDPTRKDPDSE